MDPRCSGPVFAVSAHAWAADVAEGTGAARLDVHQQGGQPYWLPLQPEELEGGLHLHPQFPLQEQQGMP